MLTSFINILFCLNFQIRQQKPFFLFYFTLLVSVYIHAYIFVDVYLNNKVFLVLNFTKKRRENVNEIYNYLNYAQRKCSLYKA